MSAYYNEHDPFAAAWLRELIADNLIAPGEVDERSIEDVTPDDLRPFQQCHFFAGIGIWSLAARRVGIPDHAPLWSGSCPCQPFSPAGKGEGFDDERHLWPAFHYLIEQCRPPLVVGEQVAGADGNTWFDLVSADLDATAYAFGVAETVACGFGAPHKRSRNYWMAHRLGARLEGYGGHGGHGHEPRWLGTQPPRSAAARGVPDQLADAGCRGVQSNGRSGEAGSAAAGGAGEGSQREWVRPHDRIGGAAERVADAAGAGWGGREGRNDRADGEAEAQSRRLRDAGTLAVTGSIGRQRREGAAQGGFANRQDAGRIEGDDGFVRIHQAGAIQPDRPGPTNGLWADPDWLLCRDEKWRPVESGTFPLADAGAFRNRVGLLRGAGNAITLGQAEGFLRAVVASIR